MAASTCPATLPLHGKRECLATLASGLPHPMMVSPSNTNKVLVSAPVFTSQFGSGLVSLSGALPLFWLMLRRCAEILTAQGQLVYGPVLRKFQVLRRSTRNWRPDILRHSLGLRKSENEALKFCGRGIKVFSSLQQPSAAFSGALLSPSPQVSPPPLQDRA